ncbi:MAG: GNAT family N-acetyltransferase [Chloroflexota bacterium]
MGNAGYSVRNYQSADFARLIKLIREVEALEPSGRDVSFEENLDLPGHQAEKNLFLVETSGEVVGYLDILPELEIGRLVLDALIHPAHLRRGLFSILLDRASVRGGELRAKVAHFRIDETNEVAQTILLKRGFRAVRRFLELNLELSDYLPQPDVPTTLLLRPLELVDITALCQLQNECFSGTWGFNPNTDEEIDYRLGLSSASTADVILACAGGRPAGYCWTKRTGGGKGQIFMLGVHPSYRGRGLGRELLLAGISRLKNRGLTRVDLSVDGENRVALSLYESLGFCQKSVSIWYEREISYKA